ncbi:hypothetical protein ACFX13_028116 [Malus domestica]
MELVGLCLGNLMKKVTPLLIFLSSFSKSFTAEHFAFVIFLPLHALAPATKAASSVGIKHYVFLVVVVVELYFLGHGKEGDTHEM